MARRFPPPWRADTIPGDYVVRDAIRSAAERSQRPCAWHDTNPWWALGERGDKAMLTFALLLVIVGNGSLGSSQPLRIGNFQSLSNCQAAAHEAVAIGFDGNASPGFVCVRVHEDAADLIANSRRDDTKNVTVDHGSERLARRR